MGYESSSAPFGLVDVFSDADGPSRFADLLPATYRTENDNIVTPYPEYLDAFLDRELLVQRLNELHAWLWICGRPMPPRPLHQQVAMSRSIVVTEQMDMHLVWLNTQIFIKPLPGYLLHPDFWSTHGRTATGALDPLGNSSTIPEVRPSTPPPTTPPQDRLACARGFLFTYTALIAYPSDFTLAQQHGLLPATITWPQWRTVVTHFLAAHCYADINPRFWYGELRLSRLNKVCAATRGWLFRGYSRAGGAATYEDLLRGNFAALATGLGYVVIVLTAMQAGLATDRLQHDRVFVNASYGFTVFSIIAPLIGAAGLLAIMLCLVASNWMATRVYERKRFGVMGVERLPRRAQ